MPKSEIERIKKPEKFKAVKPDKEEVQEWCDSCFGTGYNQACDDWEKYLNDLYSVIVEEMEANCIYCEQGDTCLTALKRVFGK